MPRSRSLLAALSGAPLLADAALAEPVSVDELAARTHFHGLAVDRAASGRLILATHHGLYVVGPDAKAERVPDVKDLMGFSPHPGGAERP